MIGWSVFIQNCLMKHYDKHRNLAFDFGWKLFDLQMQSSMQFVALLKQKIKRKQVVPAVTQGHPARHMWFLGCDVRHTPCPARHMLFRGVTFVTHPSPSVMQCFKPAPPFGCLSRVLFVVCFYFRPTFSAPPWSILHHLFILIV